MEFEEFGDPWTGGNPKHRARYGCGSKKFGDPWTGGNPKPTAARQAERGEFGDPWTGGNPKHDLEAHDTTEQFGDPWTEGNPKRGHAYNGFSATPLAHALPQSGPSSVASLRPCAFASATR